MWASLKIVNNYYWKSLFGPGVCFVFSFLFCFLVSQSWNIFGVINPLYVFPTMMNCTICIVGLYCIPLTINNIRSSVILKRLGSSSVTPTAFIGTTIIFYYVMTFISYLWMWMWCLLFFNNQTYFSTYCKIFTQYMEFGAVVYTFSINFLFSLVVGMLVLIFSKRNYIITVVAIVLVIVNTLLAGYIIPINELHYEAGNGEWRSALFYVVYIDPFWYSSALSIESFFHNGPDIFNLLHSSIFNPSVRLLAENTTLAIFPSYIYEETDKWLNLIMPIFWIISIGISDIFFFKWNIR